MRYLICGSGVPLSTLFASGDGAALIHITRWSPSGTVLEYENAEDWQTAKEQLDREATYWDGREKKALAEVADSIARVGNRG